MTELLNAGMIERQSPAAAEADVSLAPLLSLARHQKTWSPLLLPGVVWRAATNPGALIDVRRLCQLPAFAEAARSNPRFGFKYLTHDYLARSFTVAERASCFLYHHKRMHSSLPDRLLREIMRGEIMVQQISNATSRFAITMGLTQPIDCDKEGEICIKLHVDGQVVFLLSFTFVPGWIVKSKADEVLLISRLQGVPGRYAEIRHVTKSLHDVAPAALLLAVLQGVAMAFGVSEIASVNARNQSSYCEDYRVFFHNAYDVFFDDLGMITNEASFFTSPVPVPDKPLESIKQGHKLRTRKKRAFKREMMLACAGFFENVVTHSSDTGAQES